MSEDEIHIESHSTAIGKMEKDEGEIPEIILPPHGSVERYSQEIRLSSLEGAAIKIEGPHEDKEEDEEWKIDSKALSKFQSDLNQIDNFKSSIITLGVEIEDTLEDIILDLIFGKQKEFKNSKIFDNYILQSRHLDFYSKWQIFRQITKEHGKMDLTDLRRKIDESRQIRNRFAHGEIVFRNEVPHLKYYESHEQTYDEINQGYLEESLQTMQESLKELREVKERILEGKLTTFDNIEKG